MSLKQLRSYRILNIAMFDVVTSIVFLAFIFIVAQRHYYPKLNWKKFIISATLLAIPIGIVFHILFGVNTQLNYIMGLSDKPKK